MSKKNLFYIILIFCFSALTNASESDAWTYRYIELEDSKDKLNQVFNEKLNLIVARTNMYIMEQLSNGHKATDTEIEKKLSGLYQNSFFKGSIKEDSISSFERCIDGNNCLNWPKFERIVLKPHESVFHESNFTPISAATIASQIQACGVRFGTDKLTHMLNDGFKYYNFIMTSEDKNDEQEDEDYVKKMSDLHEKHFMGLQYTGVYSQSDIEANLQGYRLFNKIFKNVKRDPATGIIENTQVNLCDYINPNFDETILPNRYVSKNFDLLKKAIESRTEPEWQNMTKEELMSRTFESPEDLPMPKISVSLLWKLGTNQLTKDSASTFRRSPDDDYPRRKPHFIDLEYTKSTNSSVIKFEFESDSSTKN